VYRRRGGAAYRAPCRDVECQPRDRPVSFLNPCGSVKIIITEEMVREATRVLHQSGLLEYKSQADELVVKEMLRMAMPLARTILNKSSEDPPQVSGMSSLEK
jgi:hypothetical protein